MKKSRSTSARDSQTTLFDAAPPVAVVVADPIPEEPSVLSVTELSTQLRGELQQRFSRVIVQGELADFKGVHRSGHLYCALKDEKSQVRLVMWKPQLKSVAFELKAGLELIITGRLDYYAGSGSLQLVAERMEPVGMGALQLKFEQLKAKLEAEGLFSLERKRPVSALNWRIGIVTGRSTAALADMLRIFAARFACVELFVFPASVQGPKAAPEIVQAISRTARYSQWRISKGLPALDCLIVGRGGGSYEDLFCFNDESLVRAIAASPIPVVSAVGHEIDVTLADFVADRRAATPSHAAQECVPEALLWRQRFDELLLRFERKLRDRIADERNRLEQYQARLEKASVLHKIPEQKKSLQHYSRWLEQIMQKRIDALRSDLGRYGARLDALSPLKVLGRGFSLASQTEEDGGGLIASAKQLKKGQRLRLRFQDGAAVANVEDVQLK